MPYWSGLFVGAKREILAHRTATAQLQRPRVIGCRTNDATGPAAPQDLLAAAPRTPAAGRPPDGGIPAATRAGRAVRTGWIDRCPDRTYTASRRRADDHGAAPAGGSDYGVRLRAGPRRAT